MHDNPPRRPKSIDGFGPRPKRPLGQKVMAQAHVRKPDLRPDHDLPAPKPVPLLESDFEHHNTALPRNSVLKKPVNTANDHIDITLTDEDKKPRRKKLGVKKIVSILGVALVAGLVAAAGYAYIWYQDMLGPASEDTTKFIRVNIKSGTLPGDIATQLEESRVIRSSLAFSIYTKLTSTENNLQAGVYTLQPSLPTPKIVEYLTTGKQNTFEVTFLPGDTLANNRQKLIDLGIFTTEEVDDALNKSYNRPLFATKPANADLEGYIYGETYHFDGSATPETILNKTFDEFEAVIEKYDLVAGFKKHGLSLYEGITLASIVQREIPNAADQKQVARVFYNRMKEGMNLGSDVTYQYAADKMGVARSPSLDSPYNTRIHAGLPPGPIAAPGESALVAVANPAKNDYLFFLSGDDDKTYFAKDDDGHQRNIDQRCAKKCKIL